MRRLGIGATIVIVLAIAAVTVVIGIVRTGTSAPAVETVSFTAVDEAPAELYVHVAGEVRKPGLYRLRADARVVDAIAAAQGLTDDADSTAINLARTLTDGEQLLVPAIGAEPVTGSGTDSSGKVNINTADATALEALPRVGPAIAARIVAWRQENGRFSSVDDLLSISGIGEKMLADLRDLVTV